MLTTIKNFDFREFDLYRDGILKVENETDKIINYSSFILSDPVTDIVFPEFDKPFFDRMNYTLAHILHCYDAGWITSERQVFYSSNECLTTIQFVNREDRIQCNVFQRSSNLLNIKEDVEFLNWFMDKHFKGMKKELNILVSMPHVFKDRVTKVG